MDKHIQGEFTPKLFPLIKAGIPRETILKDAMSGVIVGIVALPLAIAFAIASGVSPERGLLTSSLGMMLGIDTIPDETAAAMILKGVTVR